VWPIRSIRSSYIFVFLFVCLPAVAQTSLVPPASQQIAAAILPLPSALRADATVIGYAPDMKLITLRAGKNGMVCTATRPGDNNFDVRCYHQSFMPIVKRARELSSQGLHENELNRAIDSEIQSKKLSLPAGPTAGYRMLGPISAYNAETNSAGAQIECWQSIHFPYKSAAQIGLPEDGKVSRTFPYVMASGTFWSHVMIEHENQACGDR
jgi:hypothetical protein